MDKDISSIDAADDDNKSYCVDNVFLQEDTDRKKSKTIFEIEEMGDKYVKEIERKKKEKNLKKLKLIPYIINNSNGKYGIDELNSYCFEDIQEIYNQIKIECRSNISKFFYFLFNIE